MLGAAEIWSGAQFFLNLPRYLRHPLTDAEARARLLAGVASRETAFLEKLRLDILPYPDRPYAQLLRCAGCEFGDIETLIAREGLDKTLATLFRAGVYLTIDEFKGRKVARRGSTEVHVFPAKLQAPRASYHMPASSGGTRGTATPVMIDLEFIRSCAGNSAVSLAVRGGEHWKKAVWESPGAGLRFRVVKYAGFGSLPAATFSQIDPNSTDIPDYFRWNLRLLRWVGAASGRRLPWPAFTPLAEPRALAEWLQGQRQQGDTPHVQTFPSSAIMVARWATENGYDIGGSWFTVTGEPITAAGVRTVEAAGCHVIPRFGSMESGAIGYGCTQGDHPDDLHLVSNMHGLIQAGAAGAKIGLPKNALLITSLHAQAPFVMLNLSMGDQAEVSYTSCGCPLEDAGWKIRLWNVRSFEKLTGTGVSFDGTEVISVLTGHLPERFGGVPTDYQLAEEVDSHGEPVLNLVVHPRLGDLDKSLAAQEFLNALSARSSSDGMMIRRWRDAGTLRVVRKPPAATAAGKIQYLHAATRQREKHI